MRSLGSSNDVGIDLELKVGASIARLCGLRTYENVYATEAGNYEVTADDQNDAFAWDISRPIAEQLAEAAADDAAADALGDAATENQATGYVPGDGPSEDRL